MNSTTGNPSSRQLAFTVLLAVGSWAAAACNAGEPTQETSGKSVGALGTYLFIDRQVASSTYTQSLSVPKPVGVVAGHVMIAAVAAGDTTAKVETTITAPTGWTLIRRTNHRYQHSLATYYHVVTDNEPASYPFAFSTNVGGNAWIAAYSGLSTSAPVDVSAGQDLRSGTSFTAPSVTASQPDDLVLTVVTGSTKPKSLRTTWAGPAGTDERVDVWSGDDNSVALFDRVQEQPGLTGSATAVASVNQSFAIVQTLALRGAARGAGTSSDGGGATDAGSSSDGGAALDAGSSGSGWRVVVDDSFDDGVLPAHWQSYDGPYGSGPKNCAAPSQLSVSGGALHMLESYRTTGNCGAGWYTAGLALSGFSNADARVTVTWKVVNRGATSHHIIPMRWPDDDALWTQTEEDWCETSDLTSCTSFLHYGSTGSNQIYKDYFFDQTTWHTTQFTRRGYSVVAVIDGAVVWSFTGDASNTTTGIAKHVVLQQELDAVPTSTTATEEILIDHITVEIPNP